MKHRKKYISYSLIVIYSLLMIHMALPHAHHHHEEDEICGQCTHQDCDEHEDAFHCHKIPQHHPSLLQDKLQKLIQISHIQLYLGIKTGSVTICSYPSPTGHTLRTYETPPILPPGCVLTQTLRAPPTEV